MKSKSGLWSLGMKGLIGGVLCMASLTSVAQADGIAEKEALLKAQVKVTRDRLDQIAAKMRNSQDQTLRDGFSHPDYLAKVTELNQKVAVAMNEFQEYIAREILTPLIAHHHRIQQIGATLVYSDTQKKELLRAAQMQAQQEIKTVLEKKYQKAVCGLYRLALPGMDPDCEFEIRYQEDRERFIRGSIQREVRSGCFSVSCVALYTQNLNDLLKEIWGSFDADATGVSESELLRVRFKGNVPWGYGRPDNFLSFNESDLTGLPFDISAQDYAIRAKEWSNRRAQIEASRKEEIRNLEKLLLPRNFFDDYFDCYQSGVPHQLISICNSEWGCLTFAEKRELYAKIPKKDYPTSFEARQYCLLKKI